MPDNISITIGGKKQTDLEFDLVEAVVDTNYSLPAMFTLVIQDTYNLQAKTFKYSDSNDLCKLGAEVKIEVETDRIPGSSSRVKATLVIGEITSIEPVFASNGVAQLLIRGYDRSHRLTRGTKTRVFLKQTDKDIVSKIAQEAGLSVESDPCSITYEYMIQYNQTDWDFLQSRARLLGFQFYVEEKKLYFKKADTERSTITPSQLEWGTNLNTFEPRITSMGQIQKVIGMGWDPDKKSAVQSAVTSTADADFSKVGFAKKGSAASKEAFGETTEYVLDFPGNNADVAKERAEARLIQTESSFVKADGSCRIGDPRIKAGGMIDITNVGKRFSGKYYVTEARHIWSGGQYTVTFSAAGYNGGNLYQLLSEKSNEKGFRQTGVLPALITNIKDPENLGRVKVKFPWMPKTGSAEFESNWARLATPAGGQERGFYFAPEINDEVLVAFEQGDLNFPYIVGVLWNKTDKPPKGTADIIGSDNKVNQRIVRSRSGHLIILDDTQGKEQIIIQDKTANNSIIIDSVKKTMTIKCEGDLTFDAGGKVIINSKQDMTLTSQAKAAISSTGEMSLDSKQKAMVKAGTSQLGLEIAGTTLKGMKVDITADTMAALKGNAMVQVQGGIVKIN